MNALKRAILLLLVNVLKHLSAFDDDTGYAKTSSSNMEIFEKVSSKFVCFKKLKQNNKLMFFYLKKKTGSFSSMIIALALEPSLKAQNIVCTGSLVRWEREFLENRNFSGSTAATLRIERLHDA